MVDGILESSYLEQTQKDRNIDQVFEIALIVV